MRKTTHLELAILCLTALTAPLLLVGWEYTTISKTGEAAQAFPGQVTDASGQKVAIKQYQRIASCSAIADALLPDLVEPNRIVSVSSWYADHNSQAFRSQGKKRIDNIKDTEAIIALTPDLILVSNFTGDTSSVERLRERGLTVFDLGKMLGMSTLATNMRDLGALLGEPERGSQLAKNLQRRMRQVAAHIPPEKRRRGMYLNLYGSQLLGGTRGSSYHDVLTAAGLVDVAADFVKSSNDPLRAWPHYRVEEVILLNPEVIVTTTGKKNALREIPGMEQLPALYAPGAVIEMDNALMNDAGPGMLRAAEELNELLYSRKL